MIPIRYLAHGHMGMYIPFTLTYTESSFLRCTHYTENGLYISKKFYIYTHMFWEAKLYP